MSTIMVEAYICQRCEHYWLPQVKRRAVRPKVCPKCKSPIWDKPRPVMLPKISLASPGISGGQTSG